MKLVQLNLMVQDSLASRGLKDPSVRQNAMENIYKFMKADGGIFLDENGDVRLPSDAIVIRNAYRKYKGYELNSAEKSVINEMYRFV